MHFLNTIKEPQKKRKANRIRVLVILIGVLMLALSVDLIYQNRDKIRSIIVKPVVINNFDDIKYMDDLHRVMHPSGAFWIISYESTKLGTFSGQVGFSTPIKEKDFALLTNDILVTNGDYSNPFIVEILVYEHRYKWLSWHEPRPIGSIGLLHVIPLDENINEKLNSIKTGDAVVIKGYDIYRVDSFDKNGNYLSSWKDDGCFTTLVTEVTVYPGALSKSTAK